MKQKKRKKNIKICVFFFFFFEIRNFLSPMSTPGMSPRESTTDSGGSRGSSPKSAHSSGFITRPAAFANRRPKSKKKRHGKIASTPGLDSWNANEEIKKDRNHNKHKKRVLFTDMVNDDDDMDERERSEYKDNDEFSLSQNNDKGFFVVLCWNVFDCVCLYV